MPYSCIPGPMTHSSAYHQPMPWSTQTCPPPGFEANVNPSWVCKAMADLKGLGSSQGLQQSCGMPSDDSPHHDHRGLTSQTVRIRNIDYKMKRKELKQKLDDHGYGCDQNGEPHYN